MSLPVPPAVISPDNQEFFSGLERGSLLLPRCDSCGEVIWYPRHQCPSCGGSTVSWFEASGRGHIYSFTIVRRGIGEWAEAAPYAIAYVELAEGPRVLTNIVADSFDSLLIGAEVQIAIERSEGHPPVLRFALL